MLKIWAQILQENKLINQYMYNSFDNFDEALIFDYVKEICEDLNLSTPVIVVKHKNHLKRYGMVTFKPQDFVEPVDFDKLILQIVQ